MTMEGSTIKTLAEYIAKLNRDRSDSLKDYEHNQFDTNGVEQDHVETFWPPNEHPRTKLSSTLVLLAWLHSASTNLRK